MLIDAKDWAEALEDVVSAVPKKASGNSFSDRLKSSVGLNKAEVGTGFKLSRERYEEVVKTVTSHLEPKKLFNYHLLEFFTGAALGYGTRQVVRTALVGMGVGVLGGVSGAVAVGAGGGAVAGLLNEYRHQVQKNYREAAADSDKKEEFKKKLFGRWTPNDRRRLVIATAKGAAFGALGGLVGLEIKSLIDAGHLEIPKFGQVTPPTLNPLEPSPGGHQVGESLNQGSQGPGLDQSTTSQHLPSSEMAPPPTHITHPDVVNQPPGLNQTIPAPSHPSPTQFETNPHPIQPVANPETSVGQTDLGQGINQHQPVSPYEGGGSSGSQVAGSSPYTEASSGQNPITTQVNHLPSNFPSAHEAAGAHPAVSSAGQIEAHIQDINQVVIPHNSTAWGQMEAFLHQAAPDQKFDNDDIKQLTKVFLQENKIFEPGEVTRDEYVKLINAGWRSSRFIPSGAQFPVSDSVKKTAFEIVKRKLGQ